MSAFRRGMFALTRWLPAVNKFRVPARALAGKQAGAAVAESRPGPHSAAGWQAG
jgi:hypothetical protein